MKFVDEFQDPERAKQLIGAISDKVTRPWTIMEVCGGQTHTILKYGIDELLPDSVTLLHGPGCPVCVTPMDAIDHAIAIAGKPGVILCSFGDMLRVPGSRTTLMAAKARGADVRVVYSPLDALTVARENPSVQVVFFAVGFETTAPATASAAHMARQGGLSNFSLLVSHVLVPPAMEAILASEHNQVDGFLAAGHVCTVMGLSEYVGIAKKYEVPIVATGFEPIDLLQGVFMCVDQLESGRADVENQYARAVQEGGNVKAQAIIDEVYEVTNRSWRGIGELPASGLKIRDAYAGFDAAKKFGSCVPSMETARSVQGACISGLVLQGVRKPGDCPSFGTACTPERPLGAPMVSSEGACAAYYRYRRHAAAIEQ